MCGSSPVVDDSADGDRGDVSPAGRLAMAYDDEFVQYQTLAEATSVARYRAVAYWMHPGANGEFEARAGMRHALGLPTEPTGLGPRQHVAILPNHSPTTMTAC